jgi:hypothetical protein
MEKATTPLSLSLPSRPIRNPQSALRNPQSSIGSTESHPTFQTLFEPVQTDKTPVFKANMTILTRRKCRDTNDLRQNHEKISKKNKKTVVN